MSNPNFKNILRREAEVAFSSNTQPHWIRVIKYIALAVLIYLFRSSKIFWIIFSIVCVLALIIHFWTRRKTAGWTRSWGLWKYEESKMNKQ